MQIGIAFIVLGIDQTSKVLLRGAAVLNSGVGFGIGQSASPLTLLMVVIGVITTLLLYRVTPATEHSVGRWAWPLIFGGIVSNLVDRVRFGAVVDQFTLPVMGIHYNIADIAIVAGFSALFIATARVRGHKHR